MFWIALGAFIRRNTVLAFLSFLLFFSHNDFLKKKFSCSGSKTQNCMVRD